MHEYCYREKNAGDIIKCLPIVFFFFIETYRHDFNNNLFKYLLIRVPIYSRYVYIVYDVFYMQYDGPSTSITFIVLRSYF